MKKNNKTIYETPIIIPLGELARGSGMPPPGCRTGDGATEGCKAGTLPAPPGGTRNCRNGSAATNKCTSGAGVV